MPRFVRSQLWWSQQTQRYELALDRVAGTQAFNLNVLESISSFSFRSRDGNKCTFRKQTVQRGSTYWYAYRRLHGYLVKRYAGKTKDLSLARLEEVTRSLLDVPSFPEASSPLPHQSEPVQPSSQDSLLFFSKMQPPRLPALLVERKALLTRLQSSLLYPVTLLQAPAGFGKTILITHWIEELRSHEHFPHVAWLSLDAGENNPIRFWCSLIRACQSEGITVGQAALTQLSQAEEPPFQVPPLETIVASFLHEVSHDLPDTLLILDDYHTITLPCLHETMTFFLDHLPPCLRVVLLSRSQPSLPLLRWRAQGTLFSLGATDLRFSLEETAAFLREAGVPSLSEEVLSQLDAHLSGWVTGLRLFAYTQQGKRSASEVASSLLSLQGVGGKAAMRRNLDEAPQPILEYFVTEILQAQPEVLQRFLLQTSVLPYLNASLCQMVINEASGNELLEAAYTAGLFLERVETGAAHLQQTLWVWYRYHGLFAEAMRREAEVRLGEATLRACSLRASFWYEQQMMMVEAIEAALYAHDFEHAARLAEQVDAQGQISDAHTLFRWLSPLPEIVLRAHPMLCWLSALGLQLREPDPSSCTRERIVALLHMAREGWQNRGMATFLGLIDAFHALCSWRKGRFGEAVDYAREALAGLKDDGAHRRLRMFRGICLFIVGTAQMSSGCWAEARSSFLQACERSRLDGGRSLTRSLLLMLGICSEVLFELHQAHEYYQQAISDACLPQDRQLIAAARLGLSRMALEWNDLPSAERQAHEAITVAGEGTPDFFHQADFQLACLLLARGEFPSATGRLAALQVRLQLAPTSEAVQLLSEVYLLLAHCQLQVGNLQSAQLFLQMPELQERMATRIFQARLLLARNQPEIARQQLEHLLTEVKAPREHLMIQLLLALACADAADQKPAMHFLRQALSQAHHQNLIRPFLSEGEPLAHLLRQLLPTLREPALHSYALSILQMIQFSDEEMEACRASGEGIIAEPLSRQEQRVLGLLAAGHSNQEIAEVLVVSINTVKDHIKHLYRKLGVNTRLQARLTARRLQLL
ncbi:LuxR C-terminal-related transcriptional regulator [Ktedonospora formicarum]|uniref:Helix-turn-helix transcriptional regulator n=1 Tax=Ktedonospora formicarum TaxID=2778364 RepID=A0A8J3HWU6_9CHLR|nr:LuxR C-terminal-related transcriptional regulator [Ktedonospora formicarum]GHO42142.1 helix-turn-helix transcriptional regulator [Ktedonospora formicarum]